MGVALVVGFPNIMTASATSAHPVCTITRYNQHPPVHQLYQRHKNLFLLLKMFTYLTNCSENQIFGGLSLAQGCADGMLLSPQPDLSFIWNVSFIVLSFI